ncbi:hypothetical protein OHC33_010853 [Knufia fluminis]|uniref:Major facilitator superfamily (MFS) profile domain-containing protein n=1 Tax=Knufia fluminis TaxID=191047 RepID=A0AAN8EF07_9EURO|nr:hypothetical protein OHC33_010853 [Knufia fluminis]
MGTDQDNTLVSSFSHDSVVAHPSTGVMKPRSLWQNLRRYPKVSAYCIALTSGILLWGYDLAMSGNLAGMDQFKEDYGKFYEDEWIIPSQWMGLWNAGSPIGMMIGAVSAGSLQDRFGRRLTLALGSSTSAIAVAIFLSSSYTTSSPQVIFFVGKLVQGCTIGMVVTTTQTYMSEVLPSVLRGSVIAFFPLFFLIGQLISAGIVLAQGDVPGKKSYRVCIMSEWPFSAIPVLVAIFMPESPIHLIRKGRLDDAVKAQRRLETSGDDTSAAIHNLQTMVQHETEAQHTDRARYIDVFKGINLRRTNIAILGSIIPQLFGLPILGDGPYFLQQAGMDSGTSQIFLISGVVAGVIGTAISLWVVARVGRRNLILYPLIPLAVMWGAMGIAGCFNSIVTAWYVGVTTNIVTLLATLSIWPASFIITAEVSSLQLRAKTQGIAWAINGVVNFLFSFVTPYIYNADAGNLRSKIGFVWLAICLLTWAACFYMVPEMRGRTPLELDLMFEQKVKTRAFRAWSSDDAILLTEEPKRAED